MYDNSQLSTYKQCPMKYYLQYIKGYVKADTADLDTLHFDFGGRFHDFMKIWYERKMSNSKEPISLSAIWSNFNDREGENVKTREGGIALCKAYIDHWKGQDEFEVLEVEKPCNFKLGEYDFVVKRDGVIKTRDNIYSFEHKSTNSLYNFGMRYFIDSQMTAQVYATLSDYGQCSGVFMNVACPQFIEKQVLFHPDAKEVKLYSEVEIKYSKYHKYKCNMAYCSGFTAKFERDTISRSLEEVEQWKESTVNWIDKIESDKESGRFERIDSSFSCSRCQYRDLCKVSKGMEIDENIADVMYEVNDNPLDYLTD